MAKHMDTMGNQIRMMSGDINALKVEHAWTIRNYSAHQEVEPGIGILSPTFFIGGSGDLQGRLVLYPHGCKKNQVSDYASLFLYLDSRHSNIVRARLKFYLLDSTRIEQVSYRSVTDFTCSQGYGFPTFARHDLLNRLLVEDALTVFCTITMLGSELEGEDMTSGDKLIMNAITAKRMGRHMGKISVKVENMEVEKTGQEKHDKDQMMGDGWCNENKNNEISESIKELLGNEFSDLTLVCQGIEFRAHRNILASRSFVFCEMFMRHSIGHDNRIVIDNVEPDVMREVLRYLYTGRIQNWDLYVGLLDAADKFCLTDLKTTCSNVLMNGINVNNVVEMLMLADEHNILMLKNHALCVIATHAKSVVMSPGFTRLLESNRPDLVAEAFIALTREKNT